MPIVTEHELDQKLELLPKINFDDNEEFQRVVMSQDFTDIFNFYKTNDLIPPKVKILPETTQRIAAYLALTGQDQSFLDQTEDLLYCRRVPDINEFLRGDRFLGPTNNNLYPYWEKRLQEIFAPQSIIKRVLWGGATGTGKTTIAREAMLYSLYRLFCLRNPRSVLNVSNSTTLAVFILSVTQKTAEQTNFNPILDIIKNMKCFQQVRSTNSFDNFDIQDDSYPIPYNIDKSNTTIRFANNIILTTGSQISNTVGYDIVISVCDEINEKGVKEGMEILNSIDGRLDSRFAGSPFTFQHVMSSARGTDSVTKEYSRKWAKDPTFLYLHPMRFEVKQTKDFIGDGTTFPILIGNGVVSNKIITDPGELAQIKDGNYEPPNGCEIVNVPTIYRNQFEADLEQQIQDMLGIDTQDSHFVFKDLSRLVDDSLLSEIHLEANINNNNKLIDLIPKEIFTTDLNGKIKLKRAPNAPRYIHADLSTSGECDTGLCMLHKEYIPNEITGGKTPVYVVDFVSYITAKNEVDLEAVKNLCIDLVVEKNVPIHTISADQYQSTLILQQWKNSNCFENVEQLSVDRTSEPYTSAATLVTTGRVKVGKCDKLKRELENLVIQNGKIMKTIELKDMADGLVGSLYSAQKNYQDVPYYLYTNQETLNIKKDNYGTLLKTDQFLVDI